MQKAKKRNIIIATVLAGLILALAVGGSLAFLTDKDSAVNVFSIGHVNIELTEPDWNPQTDGKNITPGTSEDKTPTITSEDAADNQPSYMRVKMEIIDSATGNRITDADRLAKIYECIRYDANGDKLAEKDGAQYTKAQIDACPTINPAFTRDNTYTGTTPGLYYFNYNNILQPKESKELFTNVAFPAEYTEEDMAEIGNFTITMQAQAIQANGFKTAKDAFAALQNYDTTAHTKSIDSNTGLQYTDGSTGTAD